MKNFPLYIMTNDGEKTFRCVNWLDLDKEGNLLSTVSYDVNRGYLNTDDGVVWIYAGTTKPINADQYPYI